MKNVPREMFIMHLNANALKSEYISHNIGPGVERVINHEEQNVTLTFKVRYQGYGDYALKSAHGTNY